MTPHQIWESACRSRDGDPDVIAEARRILRTMSDCPDRRKGAYLVFSWDLRVTSEKIAINRYIDAPRHESQAAHLTLCSYCGKPTDNPHSDHVIAKSRGGDDGDHNRVPACATCNARKSDKPFLRWLMEIGGGQDAS